MRNLVNQLFRFKCCVFAPRKPKCFSKINAWKLGSCRRFSCTASQRVVGGGMVHSAEQSVGRRFYFLNWIPLLMLAFFLGACLAASNFSLKLESGTRAIVVASALTGAGLWLLS